MSIFADITQMPARLSLSEKSNARRQCQAFSKRTAERTAREPLVLEVAFHVTLAKQLTTFAIYRSTFTWKGEKAWRARMSEGRFSQRRLDHSLGHDSETKQLVHSLNRGQIRMEKSSVASSRYSL